MSQPAPLDPLSLPLHGSRLIEASAGTGKTFTIALFYVRLVLGGHSVDDDTAFIRPLTPPEILVGYKSEQRAYSSNYVDGLHAAP